MYTSGVHASGEAVGQGTVSSKAPPLKLPVPYPQCRAAQVCSPGVCSDWLCTPGVAPGPGPNSGEAVFPQPPPPLPAATGSKPESMVQPRLRCTAVTGCREATLCTTGSAPMVQWWPGCAFWGLVATGSMSSGLVHCPPRVGECGQGSGLPRPSQSW